jgi:hypothetical protein
VRRLVALLVLALLGATLYGLSNNSSGISVNGSAVSASTIRAELSAISSNVNLACYVEKIDPTTFAPGAGGASLSATGAAAWANLRVEGLAIDDYATTTLHYHPNAQDLAKAETSLEAELSAASADSSSPCPGTSAEALAAMPNEMRTFEIASQAASLDVVAKLDSTIPLTLSSMKEYYAAHVADYDTICVSVAVVEPGSISAFSAAQQAGMSVSNLAKKFSVDPTGKKGGVYGCFGPSSSAFTGVRSATISTKLNTFSTTPEQITYNNATMGLFVAPTSRTTTPFAKAESTVLSDIQSANASSANVEKEGILYASTVAVDPSFGRWGASSTSGPAVFVPALPSSTSVGSEAIAALDVGASIYK